VSFADGYTVGYLPQEPELDPEKTVKEIVMEGAQETVDVLREYEEINNSFMDEEVLNDPDKMDKLIARQAAVQDRIDALDAWELDTKLERAMDALRCPPDDQPVGSFQEEKEDV
jgi:energy-dependent translational throttle protein EttA